MSFLVSACAAGHLSPEAAAINVSANPPAQSGLDPSRCQALASLVGRAGWVPTQDLVDSAMKDLRNQAVALGANYLQHDPPKMGVSGNMGSSSTPTTVSGIAYRCDGNDGGASGVASAESDASASVPAPGTTGAFTSGNAAGTAHP
jgi:hypothetical protein